MLAQCRIVPRSILYTFALPSCLQVGNRSLPEPILRASVGLRFPELDIETRMAISGGILRDRLL